MRRMRRWGIPMRNLFLILILAVLVAVPALAALEPGQAQGTLTVGNEKIPLAYAYAINHQKNEFSNRRDDVRVVVTNKPLDAAVDLANIDYSFPDGIFGIVVCIDHNRAPSHVSVQHATGMFDAGYFGPGEDYQFKGTVDAGKVEGTLTSKAITTSTTNFTFEVAINAAVRK
jgi:hypothetical protein